MPTVAKRDGRRRVFDTAAVLETVGIFTGGALLSDNTVGFSNLDLSVPLGGVMACADWEGVYIPRSERGGSVVSVRRPRKLVSLPFIPGIGCTSCSGLQNIFGFRLASISPGGGRRLDSIGLWIGADSTFGTTSSSALLPADDSLH